MGDATKLRIAILPRLGIFNISRTNGGNIVITGGYESELLLMLLQGLKLPYEFLVPKDMEWGKQKDNGSWTGLMGMVIRNEADMAIGKIYLTEERTTITDFSYPYDIIELLFATRQPGEIKSPFAFLHPFHSVVWLCVIITVLIMPFIFKMFFARKRSVVVLFFDILASFLKQPMITNVRKHLGRLLVSFWLLFASLIAQSYSSVLLSFLTFPIREEAVKNIHGLAKAVEGGEMKCYLVEGSSVQPQMQEHRDPNVRLIIKYIAENQWFLKTEPEIVRRHILDQKNAFIESRMHFRSLLGDDIVISDDIFFTFPQVIVFKKRFRLKEKINSLLHRISASGILLKSTEDFIFHHRNGQNFEVNGDSSKQITLDKLSGAFMTLMIGHGIATCVNLIEIIYFNATKYLNYKQSSIA